MAQPFRSDLDAARARADVLEEENVELREEVERLRFARPEHAAEDPAIAKMSEETLERLDEMTHAIEAVDAPAAEPAAPRGSRRVSKALPPPHPELEVVRLRAEVVRLRAEVARLRVELDRARAGHHVARRSTNRLGMFAIAVVVVALVLVVAFARH